MIKNLLGCLAKAWQDSLLSQCSLWSSCACAGEQRRRGKDTSEQSRADGNDTSHIPTFPPNHSSSVSPHTFILKLARQLKLGSTCFTNYNCVVNWRWLYFWNALSAPFNLSWLCDCFDQEDMAEVMLSQFQELGFKTITTPTCHQMGPSHHAMRKPKEPLKEAHMGRNWGLWLVAPTEQPANWQDPFTSCVNEPSQKWILQLRWAS